MPRPLDPATLVYGLKTIGDPQLSPDARHVLYTLNEADPITKRQTSQLWRCDRDGANPRRLTWTGERNSGGRWSPDGTAIAFVSDRPGQQQQAIVVMPTTEAGEARELTRHRQGIEALTWSPDGTRLAYTTFFDPANPTEDPPAEGAAPRVRVTRRGDYKQDNRGYLGERRQQIFVIAVRDGARQQLTQEPVDHHFPQWSPDGRQLAAQIPNRNGMYSQLVLVDTVTGARTPVGPRDGAIGSWSWSPSGERLVFTGDTLASPQHDFFSYDIATYTIRRLTEGLASAPVEGAAGLTPSAAPIWLDDRQVLFHSVRGGASGLEVLDAETGTIEVLRRGQALHTGFSVDRDGRYVVQAQTTPTSSGELVVHDLDADRITTIVDPNAAVFQDNPPARWERFTVRRDTEMIEAWLLTPPDFDPAKRYPLILDIHGGPAGFYGYGFTPLQQCLATHGFLVAYANPRGSTSYGRDFATAVYDDWGGEDYRDLLAVVDAVLERPYTDPGRTGIFGYSYGGYMVAWMITQTARFKAAVCGAPVFDMEAKWGTSDIGYSGNARQWGGAPWENRAFYDTRSPSRFVERVVTPTLIVQGEADERCPVGQGEQMFMSLLNLGCEVEFARYPGGFHSFPRTGPPEHRADFLTRTLAWFQTHLGEPTP